MPARGALVACLTGLVTLTSTRIYDLHYSTYTHVTGSVRVVACLTGLVTLTSTRIYVLHYSTYTCVPGSVNIHILRTVVLDYGELLAYWFTLHGYSA